MSRFRCIKQALGTLQRTVGCHTGGFIENQDAIDGPTSPSSPHDQS